MPRSEESQREQLKRIRSFWVSKRTRDRLRLVAETNGEPMSEIIRDAMAKYAKGIAPRARSRDSTRVTAWVEPEMYAEFVRVANEHGVSQSAALESALEEIL